MCKLTYALTLAQGHDSVKVGSSADKLMPE